ncbi:hypothetical protein CYMTET_26736 [Cymbomonas tetramitiformis]|uniref:Uncharacterized protein n=1 Tax=Cymbomonas tetramitiformis TaxID=36881 RepID=A0AAE0FRH0_9CHLO|nr:hypothetical protein CYMTET_26736 [Cymbomonas tetramitiformis]
MELAMRLYCVTEVTRPSKNGTCQLDALADLQIAADLPGILKALPGVQTLGNGILDTILAAIEVIARAPVSRHSSLSVVKTIQLGHILHLASASAAVSLKPAHLRHSSHLFTTKPTFGTNRLPLTRPRAWSQESLPTHATARIPKGCPKGLRMINWAALIRTCAPATDLRLQPSTPSTNSTCLKPLH